MERTTCFAAVELALDLPEFASNLSESCSVALGIGKVATVVLEVTLVVRSFTATRSIGSQFLAAVLNLLCVSGTPSLASRSSERIALQTLIGAFLHLSSGSSSRGASPHNVIELAEITLLS